MIFSIYRLESATMNNIIRFLKGFNMRKHVNLGLIIVTSILPILLALFVLNDEANTFIWALYLVPSFLIIISSPKWITSIITIIGYMSIELITQYFFLDIVDSGVVGLKVLVINPIVNAIIFFTLTYYRMKFKKITDDLEDLVVHDPLTGIYNRRYFDISIEKNISANKRAGTLFQFILLDIDHFKMINDTYGHPGGDYILKELTRLISNEIRGVDIFARIGGEEFTILLPETTIERGEIIAQRIRKLIEEARFVYNDTLIPVTVSIGLAAYKGGTISELMDKADIALYKAKNDGRNQVVVAN